MKYYAVKKGLTPGIYETWPECKEQVHGYPGAEYHSFPTREEAEEWLYVEKVNEDPHTRPYAYVDGSYNAQKEIYGYGGVLYANEERYVLKGVGAEMASMNNVAGEISGAMEVVKKGGSSWIKRGHHLL